MQLVDCHNKPSLLHGAWLIDSFAEQKDVVFAGLKRFETSSPGFGGLRMPLPTTTGRRASNDHDKSLAWPKKQTHVSLTFHIRHPRPERPRLLNDML